MSHIRDYEGYVDGLISTDIMEWPHIGLVPLGAAQVNQLVNLLNASISRYIGYFYRSHIVSLTKKGLYSIHNNF